MVNDLVLGQEEVHKFNVVLTKLIDKARVDCVLLINKSGRLLTSQSETADFDRTSLAALIVGAFMSSTTIANIIGEDEFTSMFHQGKKRHTFILQIDENTIMAILFDHRTTIDKVRMYSQMYSDEIREALALAYSRFDSDPNINLDLSGYRGRDGAEHDSFMEMLPE